MSICELNAIMRIRTVAIRGAGILAEADAVIAEMFGNEAFKDM